MRSIKLSLFFLTTLSVISILVILINKDFIGSKYFCWSAYFKNDLNKKEGAIQDYSTALKLNPDFTFAFIGRSTVYSDLKKYNEALNDLNSAYELEPYNPDIYVNRGRALYHLNRIEEALADYNLALELDDEFAFAYYSRGVLLCSVTGLFEKGYEDLMKASELGFTSADKLMSHLSCRDQ